MSSVILSILDHVIWYRLLCFQLSVPCVWVDQTAAQILDVRPSLQGRPCCPGPQRLRHLPGQRTNQQGTALLLIVSLYIAVHFRILLHFVSAAFYLKWKYMILIPVLMKQPWFRYILHLKCPIISPHVCLYSYVVYDTWHGCRLSCGSTRTSCSRRTWL